MARDHSPTARALATLELIQAHPGISADRIGARLGVSERAARRYVTNLRAADIPIVAARGPYGGYRVGRGVRPPPLVFTGEEALALVMAVLDGHHEADDMDRPVGTALGKIVRSLPDTLAAPVRAVRDVAAPAPDRGAARPDPATTSALVQACAAHRCVRLSYRSESGNSWETEVDPWAVVVRHGRWYLLCRAHVSDARRAYRVDRVASVVALDVSFEPPPGLDAVAELETHLAVGWEYDVEVMIEAPAHRTRSWLARGIGRVEPIDGSSCRLVGTTSDPPWYASRLAEVPVPYRVLGGPELRAVVRAVGRRMVAATD